MKIYNDIFLVTHDFENRSASWETSETNIFLIVIKNFLKTKLFLLHWVPESLPNIFYSLLIIYETLNYIFMDASKRKENIFMLNEHVQQKIW